MPNRLDLPSVLVTMAMVGVSIWLWITVIVDNTDYGVYTDAIRLLVIAFLAMTFAMVAGCIVKYNDWYQEDLESMGNIKR
jgi:hypothetical protein